MTDSTPPATGSSEASPKGDANARRRVTKTPMYTALNSSRYERQELIKRIDETQCSSLICYVSGPDTEIERDDLLGFVELVHNVEPNTPVDLLLQTPGGDVDASEKIIKMLLAHVGDAPLRIIVPDMAKSSGTLIALGAKSIVMSDTSELGMIDPQYLMQDRQGNRFSHSIVEYLRAYDGHVGALSTNPKDTVANAALEDFDAKVVQKFRSVKQRVRVLAENLLKKNGVASYTAVVAQLLEPPELWKTHGQPIMHADAFEYGLPIQYMQMSNSVWRDYWMLYCLQRKEAEKGQKLFESAYASYKACEEL